MAARRKARKKPRKKPRRKPRKKPPKQSRKDLARKQHARGYADQTLAERLVHVRRQHGLTQTDVATETGIPFDTLGNYERYESSAPFWRIRQLAIYYDVSLDYLAGRTNQPKQKGKGKGKQKGKQAQPARKRRKQPSGPL